MSCRTTRHLLAARAALLAVLGTVPLAASAAAPATPAPVAAPAPTVEDGLRQVLDDALAANLELRAGEAAIAQRMAGLDQARARYLPAIDIAARYSVADGGRTIELPVGDLLNPVYATLD
jgi:outer membrane protein TolC